jgi:hypothetical protein
VRWTVFKSQSCGFAAQKYSTKPQLKNCRLARRYVSYEADIVIKLPDQNDKDFEEQFSSLNSKDSSWIMRSSIGENYSIWSCEIPQIPEAIGLWIGHLPEFFSYLAIKPVSHGNECGYEAFRAWTDPCHRGKGFGSELLIAAANFGNIFSDHDGMSCSAHKLWLSQKNLNLEYFDGKENKFTSLNSIPKNDLFTDWEQGRRWYMVLQKTHT